MIDFYEKLQVMGLYDILREVPYNPPKYSRLGKVLHHLADAVNAQKKVLIYGDYDVDGLMCSLIISDGLAAVGLKDYDVFQYRSRMHSLDRLAVQQCLQGEYDYFIIGDTGFGIQDFDQVNMLAEHGIKVVILDHHESEYKYDDFHENVAAINTMLEKETAPEAYDLSAGALCFTVMDALAMSMNKESPESLAAYATISLFADCMDMRRQLNRAIYYRARHLEKTEIPRKVHVFMNEYSAFNARFIGFWFSPRVNAVFRSERLQLLNQMFLQKSITVSVEVNTLRQINEVYEESRKLVGKVVDIIDVTEMKNFVFTDLNSVNKYVSVEYNKLYNYTGLVANQLSDQYDKTAVVICPRGTVFKGSLRDMYGRDYLTLFKKLCAAGGHNPAFGFTIGLFEKEQFVETLGRIDKLFAIEKIENKPIIIDYEYNSLDVALIEDIALYNEFAGPSIPIVLVRKQIIGGIREGRSNYYSVYDWDGYTIQSNHRLDFGSFVLLKPFRSWHTKLLVQ